MCLWLNGHYAEMCVCARVDIRSFGVAYSLSILILRISERFAPPPSVFVVTLKLFLNVRHYQHLILLEEN